MKNAIFEAKLLGYLNLILGLPQECKPSRACFLFVSFAGMSYVVRTISRIEYVLNKHLSRECIMIKSLDFTNTTKFHLI